MNYYEELVFGWIKAQGKRDKMTRKPIDDNDVLNSFYDDRETFVVDYNPDLVYIDYEDIVKGEIVFKLKKG